MTGSMRAGTLEEAVPESGHWIFVDLGFSSKSRSCGFLEAGSTASALTFAELRARLVTLTQLSEGPLNLAIEAPLSVAFDGKGNPTGRSIELRNSQARYWYVGLGCSVLVAATYLIRAIHDSRPLRNIRLFEGFVSFKPKGVRSSHRDDVEILRRVIWRECAGVVTPAAHLRRRPSDSLMSALSVAGIDYGVPPVIVAN